jgi:hypothetical protein
MTEGHNKWYFLSIIFPKDVYQAKKIVSAVDKNIENNMCQGGLTEREECSIQLTSSF